MREARALVSLSQDDRFEVGHPRQDPTLSRSGLFFSAQTRRSRHPPPLFPWLGRSCICAEDMVSLKQVAPAVLIPAEYWHPWPI